MTVKEQIKELDGRIYLGASTGFVAIGDVSEILGFLPEINVKYYTLFRNRIALYGDVIKTYPEKIRLQAEKVDNLKAKLDSAALLVANGLLSKKSYENIELQYGVENSKLNEYKAHLKKARTYYPKIKSYVDNWKGFEDREVIEFYKVDTVNHGTVVICDGKEAGKYWLDSEFERDMKKHGK